jgi:hypothetical protein
VRNISSEVSRNARLAGVFCWNVLIALFGTQIFTIPLAPFLLKRPIYLYTLQADIVSAAFALGLGYIVFLRSRAAPAKWVWLLGVCWLGQRGVLWWLEQRGLSASIRHSIYWEMSGGGSEFEAVRFADWAGYTLPFLELTFYSVGAFACSRLRNHDVHAG